MRLGTADAIARSLNGAVNLNLTKGHIAGVNVLNELSTIGKFVGYSMNPQNATQIEKLSGDLRIVDGVANTNNLQLQMDAGSLAAAGSMNLVNETLNLKSTAVLNGGTSQKAGGKGIGGFMQTALANGNGELVIPAIVTGTFSHPHFAPDVAQMAQMKMKNLLPSASAPGKALTNILGGSTQGGNQQIQNAVGGALNSIFGGKKKQQ
jgi:uncharacterized protein involved in outer membrane biogenesis